MTTISNTAQCKELLETSGITGWKRTSKCKFLDMDVRTFQAGANQLAVIVTDANDTLLAHSVNQYDNVYEVWEKEREMFNNLEEEPEEDDPIISVVPTNFMFAIDGEELVDGENVVTVMLTPIEYWVKEQCWYDQHVATDENSFPDCVSIDDDMESCYSVIDNSSKKKVFLDMINHGFYWEKFCQDMTSGDY